MTIILWQLRATPPGTLQLIDVNLAGVVVAVILMGCLLLCWWLGWRCIAIRVLILSSGEDTPVYFSKAVGSPCMSGICPSNRWNSYFQRTEKMVSLHGMHWGLKKSTIVSWKKHFTINAMLVTQFLYVPMDEIPPPLATLTTLPSIC